jgi:hypothetical protein
MNDTVVSTQDYIDLQEVIREVAINCKYGGCINPARGDFFSARPCAHCKVTSLRKKLNIGDVNPLPVLPGGAS